MGERDAARRRWGTLCRSPAFRAACSVGEHRTAPGILVHYALRKRHIEDTVRRFLQGHPDGQILVLGGGYDTLALRLSAEFPDAAFGEFDHPSTQNGKRTAIARHFAHSGEGSAPVNFTMTPCDLSAPDGTDTIRAARELCHSRDILTIAEGLFMYLPEPRVQAIFQAVAAFSVSAKFVFTFLERQPDGAIDFQQTSSLIQRWLHVRREPFLWGIHRRALSDWLSPLGWRTAANPLTPEDLRRQYLAPDADRLLLPTQYRPAVGDLIGEAESPT